MCCDGRTVTEKEPLSLRIDPARNPKHLPYQKQCKKRAARATVANPKHCGWGRWHRQRGQDAGACACAVIPPPRL